MMTDNPVVRRAFKPRRALLLIAGWVLTTAAGVAIIGAVARPSPPPARLQPANPVIRQPLAEGRRTTIAGAQATAGFPVPVPTVALANRAGLTQVWANRQQHQVALVFDRGKVTVTMWPAPAGDPAVFLRKLRAGIDAKTAIIRMDGRPTLVITPHTDPNNPNPAWVEFDRQGVEVNIYSSTYGTRALLGVAASMR